MQKSEFGKWYCYLNDAKRNWNEAKERCAATEPDGVATLTSIHSQEENNFVQSLIDDSYWIGGTDEIVEGLWRGVNLKMRA